MLRIPPRSISKTPWIILALGLSLFAQTAAAQVVDDETLEYYLFQSFEANRPEQRIALNHIGIEVQPAAGGFLVTAALEGYPAHSVGIERGDMIVSVEGEAFHPIHSFNTRDEDSGHFAPSSQSRRLEYERLGVLESVEIVPVYENLYDSYRTATLQSAQAFPLGNKIIGYIRFWGLTRSTADLFALDLLLRDFPESDGMIIDLRNSYGYLSSEHLDMFVRDGRAYFESSDASNRHASLGPGIPTSSRPITKPAVVLINSKTRGGGELFAYGLSKLERITTMGENSEGRLGIYAQEGGVIRYEPGAQTLIDGLQLEGIGITPELPIAFPFTQSGRNDPQFESAVDFLLGRI